MSWPVTQVALQRLVRVILQDTATQADQQDIDNIRINEEIDRATREICVALKTDHVTCEASVALVDGQAVYELDGTTFAGAWDISRVGYGPPSTTNVTLERIDRELLRVSHDDAKRYMSGGGYAASTGQGEPRIWWLEPKGAWTNITTPVAGSSERRLQIGVWPAPDTAAPLNTNVLWVRAKVPFTSFGPTSPGSSPPDGGAAGELYVLSLPPPADRAIAELAASWILGWRGDTRDAELAHERYKEAMITLQSAYGSSETQTPEYPVDVFDC